MRDYYQELDRVCMVFVRGRWMRVVTRNNRLYQALMGELRFRKRVQDARRVRFEPVDMFDVVQERGVPNLICMIGLYERVVRLVAKHNVELVVVDAQSQERLYQHANMGQLDLKIPRADWNGLRQWQRDAIQIINTYKDGRFGVATGGGKSTLIRYLCKFMPDKKILVAAKAKSLVDDLHRNIMTLCTSVGIHHSSNKDSTGRILVCSLGCLPNHTHKKFDVCFGDEIQEHVTPSQLDKVAMIKADRCYGFSANLEDRKDNADAWANALYGPIRMVRPYQDVESDGDVVPIRVKWLSLEYCTASCSSTQASDRARHLIWANEERNQAFVRTVEPYMQDGKQVLFLVDTTEHALLLQKMVGCSIVVSPPTQEKIDSFRGRGLIDSNYTFLNRSQINDVQDAFAKGELRTLIANRIWHTGKDFPSLDVLARLDANATEIGSTQIPGRLSRTAKGKTQGILIDSRDRFDKAMMKRGSRRRRSYLAKGWQEIND